MKTKIIIEIEHDEEMPTTAIYDIFHQLEWGYHTTLADLEEDRYPCEYWDDTESWILSTTMTNEDGYFWCKNATQAAYEMARLSRLQWATNNQCGLDDWFNYMHENSAYGAACNDLDTLYEKLSKYNWWIDKEFEDVSRYYLDTEGAQLQYCETFNPVRDGEPDCYGYVIKCECD